MDSFNKKTQAVISLEVFPSPFCPHALLPLWFPNTVIGPHPYVQISSVVCGSLCYTQVMDRLILEKKKTPAESSVYLNVKCFLK